MNAIETFGLGKRYGEKTALHPLDLTVSEGELFALLGTNGAGKTTAIRMLTTLIPPGMGGGRIFGHDLSEEKEAIRRIINVSPQETAIAPNLTVSETLDFMMGIYGVREPEKRKGELVSLFGLSEVMKQRGKTLSGGWQRKLSIALSLVNEPRLLFLDEPTLGLDVLSRRELWRAIEGLKGKTTLLLTTHYMDEAEALSDRVAILHKGELIALDTPAALKERTGTARLEDAFAALVEGRGSL